MNFLNSITISEITHVSIVNFKTGEKSGMVLRPWHGIAFSLGGELVYIHNNATISLKNNHIVYLPKEITYDIRCIHGGSFALINFQATQDIAIQDFKITESTNQEIILRTFFAMNNVFPRGFVQHRAEILSYAYKIFSLIAYNELQIVSPLLSQAIEYIDQNLQKPQLSNSFIANQLHISEVYLRKLFTNTLSVSVKKYIIDKRIEKSKALIREGALTITDISERCGYSNVYYFSRSFKEKTGLTPTEYSKQNQFF